MSSTGFSRRRLLGAGTVLSAASAAAVWGGTTTAHATDEFDQLRQRWADLLTGTDIDPSQPQIAKALETMDAEAEPLFAGLDTSGGDLWTDLPLAGPDTDNVGGSYIRLETLAIAWATTGSSLSGRDDVADKLVAGLRILHDGYYNPTKPKVGNWWYWEIGNPKRLLNACVLLYGSMPADDLADNLATVRHFVPDPNYRGTSTTFAETGANRTDKALACAIRGILGRNATELATARDALSDVEGGGTYSLFRYVTSGDGFYADGSYIQHAQLPYVGTYGNVALSGVGNMLALLGGSTWEITDPDRSVLLDAPEKSFAPFIWNGVMMDTVRGRAVSRERERDYTDGFTTVSTMLLMATGLPVTRASRYRALARGWIERSPRDYLANVGIPEISRALTVLAGDTEPAPEPVGHQQFPNQDRAVHRRPGWAFTVSVSTDRIGRYEWGNDENNLGWYQGDGMTYLYLDNARDHFADEFWPTVNPYRLPGTTIGDQHRDSGEGSGTGIPPAFRPWGGGTWLAGRYGAIGMDHLAYDKNLRARKSWFCLDDRVVALGADVTATTGHGISTVVENRNLQDRPDATVLLDGRAAVARSGDVVTTKATWAHIDGVGGYLLGSEDPVRVERAECSGSWRVINAGGDTGGDDITRTRTYVSVELDHGVNPSGKTYCYTILPGASADATKRAARDDGVTVLINSADAQAIRTTARPGHLVLGNFFAAAATKWIAASDACSVVARWLGRVAEVSVSDPSRTSGTVQIRLPHVRMNRTVSTDDGIRVVKYTPLTLEVDLSGTKGAPRTISLSR